MNVDVSHMYCSNVIAYVDLTVYCVMFHANCRDCLL